MPESTAITTSRQHQLTVIVEMVTNSVTSQHTARAYRRALVDFVTWYMESGQQVLNKAAVNAYVKCMRDDGIPASSINQRLVAIRRLAREAADNDLIDHSAAEAIARAKGVDKEGVRLGHWLSRAEAQRLLDAPDATTLKGLRDRALLAILLGCGLRREECMSLTVEHIQQRDGRWLIVDLLGKRNKLRSVPMPDWAKATIDEWLAAGSIGGGYIFRSVSKGGVVSSKPMTTNGVYAIVNEYAKQLGLTVHPHDLRRTFAKLAHKGGAPIGQIQLSLGHDSIRTTEIYLGVTQDLTSAPCDVLGLRV